VHADNLDHFDNCVVGLAIALALVQRGQSVLVLEKEPWYGSGVSSRNSEVIHAGIYYPVGSLKAKLCVEGKARLYHYCETHGVRHQLIGKLIVASSVEQNRELEAILQKARANGVEDLQWVDLAQLRAWEPQVAGHSALLSPSTGIVDSHGLMSALLAEIETGGGTLCLKTEFQSATPASEGYRVTVDSVGEPYHFHCTHLINAAGLGAQSVAGAIEGLTQDNIPPLYYCKGHYFSLSGASPFHRLIYPIPEANTTGLGIHATLDLQGQVRFGPDTLYQDQPDYSIPDSLRDKFAVAIRRYYPTLDEARLIPAYAGIRPKIQGPQDPAKDFIIDQPLPGLVNLFGIESPGLTSSLAIAEHVANQLR